MFSDPLAYFLTMHTYGTWLHGEDRGSVDNLHRNYGEPFVPPDPVRNADMLARMSEDALTLDELQRASVQASMLTTIEIRQWRALALHTRTTHVHVVLVAVETPEHVMDLLKSYATQCLRAEGLIGARRKVWIRHGSTRYLWDEASVDGAVHYVVYEQGHPLLPLPVYFHSP
jgi:hypothetical protein